MRMRLVLAVAMAYSTVLAAQSVEDTTALLRQKDQILLDAIAPGDRAVWDKMISTDFFYVDENNRVIDRATFLKELSPMPNGTSGTIAIVSYQMHRLGDTAIVVQQDDETEHYFGSELHAQYLISEIWQLLAGDWKLRQVHSAAVPVDPPTIVLTATQMDDLVGTYIAGTLTYVISRHDSLLMGGQPGHKQVDLKAETRDVLIVLGQPRSRKVFLRDGTGKVLSFADRRDNRDLIWTRR